EVRMVVIQREGVTIELMIDSPIMNVTSNKITNQIILDVSPQLMGNRTMLPIRAIAEQLKYQVEWDQISNLVKIY
ncbi:MAG: copper amine oxidase N-terminal domain-containing protein, partial [Eubacteriales bacterium]|nr:copper amine oxidase N-terminal domain-containing protein [Eubacteriales bacterium]